MTQKTLVRISLDDQAVLLHEGSALDLHVEIQGALLTEKPTAIYLSQDEAKRLATALLFVSEFGIE